MVHCEEKSLKKGVIIKLIHYHTKSKKVAISTQGHARTEKQDKYDQPFPIPCKTDKFEKTRLAAGQYRYRWTN